MTMKCTYASTCQSRLRNGDMPNSCNDRDERVCPDARKLHILYPKLYIQKVPDFMLMDSTNREFYKHLRKDA